MISTNNSKKITTLINRKTLLAMIPLSDRAIYDMEKRGEFPRRIILTSRKVAWDLAEVEQWIAERKQSSEKAISPVSTTNSEAASLAKQLSP